MTGILPTYHNSQCATITPFVDFICDIPDAANQSFYRGQTYVGLKNTGFEPSNSLRHVAELLRALSSKFGMISPYFLSSEFDMISPYLSLLTDGRGNHNITSVYNQFVLFSLFLILNLDIFNIGRRAPNQSYINPAEKWVI